ncbi:MAG: BatD family protein [Pseudomonadota bacterium]
MRQHQALIGALGLATLLAFGAIPAVAAPATPTNTATASALSTGRARASLRLDLGRGKVWLGQTIPVTISAQFRDVDGVTLEGLPQIKSDAIFSSDIAREPKQATQIVNGESVLIASWSGTITPSTAGPLGLSVELPVRIRFHDPAPEQVARAPEPDESDEDPFQGMMNIDPWDPGSVQRMFQSMRRSWPMQFDEPRLGRAHDEALTLKASTRPLDVQALPSSDQPATFGGAVGHFDLHASVSTASARANEPLTLTVTLSGDGDLDRVDLNGVASSHDWKTYPIRPKSEPPAPGKRLTRKTFEQVLVPTHGGALTIPSIELPVFDPVSGRYATTATAPLAVAVEGPPLSAFRAPEAAHVTVPNTQPADHAAERSLPPPAPSALLDRPKTIALRLAPVLLLLLGAALKRWGWRRDPENALHRALRQSAKLGSVSAFFESARQLIVLHFAKRWGMNENEITAEALRSRLGTNAEPLIDAISTCDALRFGRRQLEPVELGALCSSIEESLRKAA